MFDRRTLLDAAVASTAALLVVPVVDLLPIIPSVTPMYLGAAAGTFAVVVAAANSAEELPAVLNGRASVLLFGPPLCAFAWFAYRAVAHDVVVHSAGVGAVAAVPAGLGLALAHSLVQRRRLEGAERLVSFAARRPNRTRSALVVALVALSAIGLLAGAVSILAGEGIVGAFDLLPMVGGAAGGATATAAEREVTVTDEGVHLDGGFYAWADFTSYAITDEAIVLDRPSWRWAITFDRADVEDVEPIRQALDRHLATAE